QVDLAHYRPVFEGEAHARPPGWAETQNQFLPVALCGDLEWEDRVAADDRRSTKHSGQSRPAGDAPGPHEPVGLIDQGEPRDAIGEFRHEPQPPGQWLEGAGPPC